MVRCCLFVVSVSVGVWCFVFWCLALGVRRSWLFVVRCSLFVARSLMFVVCCLRFVCCLVLVARSLLFIACCVLFVVSFVSLLVCCELRIECCM